MSFFKQFRFQFGCIFQKVRKKEGHLFFFNEEEMSEYILYVNIGLFF